MADAKKIKQNLWKHYCIDQCSKLLDILAQKEQRYMDVFLPHLLIRIILIHVSQKIVLFSNITLITAGMVDSLSNDS